MYLDNEYGLKDVQGVLLEVLKGFDDFCKANEIEYSLACGTLLGAIRHEGFIPWDDDLDVLIDRENFTKLMSAWCNTDKLVMERYLWTQRIRPVTDDERYRNCTLDIFVNDNCPDNTAARIVKCCAVRALQLMMHEKYALKDKNIAKRIINTAAYVFGSLFSDEGKYRALDSVSQWGNSKKTRCVTRYNDNFKQANLRDPREIFEGVEPHRFENLKLPVYTHWDEVLKVTYGDYMQLPPENKRRPKH